MLLGDVCELFRSEFDLIPSCTSHRDAHQFWFLSFRMDPIENGELDFHSMFAGMGSGIEFHTGYRLNNGSAEFDVDFEAVRSVDLPTRGGGDGPGSAEGSMFGSDNDHRFGDGAGSPSLHCDSAAVLQSSMGCHDCDDFRSGLRGC